jgi:hypothetical protein
LCEKFENLKKLDERQTERATDRASDRQSERQTDRQNVEMSPSRDSGSE